MEMAIHCLHTTYPGTFTTSVVCGYPEIFLHNPYVTGDYTGREIEMDYVELLYSSRKHNLPFSHSYVVAIEGEIGLPIDITCNRPHIYLSREDIKPIIEGPYIVFSAGIKDDIPLKQWPYYQEVVDYFQKRIKCVQIGLPEHNGKPINGAVNLIGKTNIRQLFQLCYRAVAGLGPVTFLQHICASFQVPYFCLVGGRESPTWCGNYPLQHTFHTVGALSCCEKGPCLAKRPERRNDNNPDDRRLCQQPVNGLGKCMRMIDPEQVIRSIENVINRCPSLQKQEAG